LDARVISKRRKSALSQTAEAGTKDGIIDALPFRAITVEK
jgi:hypothetical protein